MLVDVGYCRRSAAEAQASGGRGRLRLRALEGLVTLSSMLCVDGLCSVVLRNYNRHTRLKRSATVLSARSYFFVLQLRYAEVESLIDAISIET